jgi:group I intron endonuclease
MVIYITTNLVNGKKYIGRDSHNNPNYYGSGPAIKNAIKKYGKHNFKKEIIEECSSFEKLIEREEYWLNYYDAGNNRTFYNLQNSGKGVILIGEKNPFYGKKHSHETKQKMSERRTEKNPMHGKKHSHETKQKMSLAHMGKVLSEETRKKLSISHTGKHLSEETKRKMSESQLTNRRCGEKNHFYGKKHSTETIHKIREKLKGRPSKLKGKTLSDEHRKKISEGIAGENNPYFKGYVVCISGKHIGEKHITSMWSSILGISSAHIYQHLNGKKYKKGVKGNILKWEHDI